MSQARCSSLESCSSTATTAPLHQTEGRDTCRSSGRKNRSVAVGGSSRLAVTTAAAALALSTVCCSSSSSAVPGGVSAFVASPLHEFSAPRRIPTAVGRRAGRLNRSDGFHNGDHNALLPSSSPFLVEDATSNNYRAPTSLIMAVTDPETLLRDEDFATALTKIRNGPPARGGKRAASAAAATRILQPGSSIYFVPEKISELNIELEKTPNSGSGTSSRLARRGTIQKRGRSPVSLERTKKAASKKDMTNPSMASKGPKKEAVAAAAAPQTKQIIESELEVVVEGGKPLTPPPPPAVKASAKTAARSIKPISSTYAEQKRSVKARRKGRAAAGTTVSSAGGDVAVASDGPRLSTSPSSSTSPKPVRSAVKKMMMTTKQRNTSSTSKSSTMPGFADRKTSGRHRAFRDGVRIAEERSGNKNIKKVLNSESLTNDRRKANSEAMYKGSASVPDSLIAYTNEIHEKTERITPTEEVELGTKTQEAIRLQQLYEDLEIELNREPTDAEWCAAAGKINTEALRNAIEDGMDSKNRLVEANLRLVQGVVNLYIRNGLGSQYNAGDLMQEGTMALIRAAEKFEPERGFRFSTYAMYWIRSAVKRSQILQSRVIQVPQRLHETHKRVLKVEKELKGELGRDPTKQELSLASNLSELQLDRCLAAMAQKCYSLDATIQNSKRMGSGADRKETMYDIVNGKMEDEGYRKSQQKQTKDSLIHSLRRVLTPHEVDLLLLRYGLMDERTLPHGFAGPLTIAEVSRLVGLKPDKVRRMINKCLSKLRPLIAHEWEDYERELL